MSEITPNTTHNATHNKRLHPLVATAAVSVIVLSLVGVAAMTGLLPNLHGEQKADSVPASTAAVGQNPAQDNNPAPNGNAAQTALPQAPVDTRHVETVRAGSAVCDNCGVVASVRTLEQQPAQGSGAGAVAGAVIGGVLGHQVGGGNGQTLATVAGAVGGGYAGNTLEKRMHTTTTYETRVRLENGHTKTFKSSTQPAWQAGDHVKVVNGNLQAD